MTTPTILAGPAPKTLVSLRVPAALVTEVEQYAAAHDLRKTDAYLHFLDVGLRSEQGEDSTEKTLGLIQGQLDTLIDLLQTTGNGRFEPMDAADRSEAVEEVRAAVCTSAQKFPAIRRAYLFGSFARGTFGPRSDIDIRLEIDRGQGFNLHDLSHFIKAIEQATHREVDVVSADTIKNGSLAAAIERDKVLIYEREEH